MADNKELPVVAWLNHISLPGQTAATQPPLYFSRQPETECSEPVVLLADATAALSELRAEVERLNGKDMKFRKRIARLLAELNGEEVLSESQCARYFGTDLVSWRHIAHAFTFGTSFVEGEGGEALPETSPIEDAINAARSAASGESAEGGV